MSASVTATDPLKLLREYTIQHKSVEFLDKDGNPTKELLQAETVRFGEDASFPRDAPTSYVRGNSESDHYPLSALLHFLDYREQSFYEYMKTANAMGLSTVSFGDRINLLNYLTGKTSETTQVAEGTALAGNKRATGESDNGDSRRKRSKAAAAGGDDAGNNGSTANDAAREIIRRERLIVTTSSALSSNKSFERVPELIKEVFPSKQPGAANGSGDKSHGSGPRKHGGSRKRRDPIIVVPAATTAMINMYNIKDLLQDHKFVESREFMEKGGPKPRELHVDHTLSDGSSTRFRVVDSVQDFTDNDWAAIVCVFTQGAAWQFKNWTWKSPEEVFKNCLGFYPKYQDERPKETTRTWGISMLNIERSKRHTDRATVVGLWNSIERHMASHKSEF
ncbi:accessory factor associated with RNA polymerase II [Linderina macrospora]|uniref:Accessory factor associated with RNA polymerase II n=1 Tax=Linderina macrospora TaxID=4868 RepID=A0ACC1JA12_9FUNG|nr:accessory factor associated with RNA polymerase II [Linderina macrospora]